MCIFLHKIFLIVYTYLDCSKHHILLVSGIIILTFIQKMTEDNAFQKKNKNILNSVVWYL